MARPDAYPFEQAAEDLTRVYRDVQRTIIAQINAAIASGNLTRLAQRRLQLAAVLATLDQLGAEVEPQARRIVADAYQQGAARAAVQIAGLTVVPPEIPGAFAGVSTEAVQALQDQITGQLQGARQTIGRQVNDVYARKGREQARRAILGAEGSPLSASKRLQRDLEREGVTGFRDTAGRRWSLENYTRMAVRTTTREAVVQGAIDRMVSHNISLARVSIHASSCEICRPYEGRLVDLGGNTTEYQGEAVFDGSVLPPYHPNCRHSLAPVASRVEEFIRTQQGATA